MKNWKKVALCAMLFFMVGTTVEVYAQEKAATPQIVDNMARKLGRGISNVAFGALELPINWYQVNFEEGGFAACTYGILKGVIAVVIREVVGVVEIVTFPFPLPYTKKSYYIFFFSKSYLLAQINCLNISKLDTRTSFT